MHLFGMAAIVLYLSVSNTNNNENNKNRCSDHELNSTLYFIDIALKQTHDGAVHARSQMLRFNDHFQDFNSKM